MFQNGMFRYSRWDAISVSVIPLQVAFYVVLAYEYRELSPATLVALIPVLFALSLQNAGANHNHYPHAILPPPNCIAKTDARTSLAVGSFISSRPQRITNSPRRLLLLLKRGLTFGYDGSRNRWRD